MPAHYKNSVLGFLDELSDNIIGELASRAAHEGFYQHKHAQTLSWETQIEVLRNTFASLAESFPLSDWSILLEFPIPRRAKRIDAVILAGGSLLVLEFKCGATTYDQASVSQVEDYCLDLRDFHKPSAKAVLCPILIATDAPSCDIPILSVSDQVGSVLKANAATLAGAISQSLLSMPDSPPIDLDPWDLGEYAPTPTIVEAAQHLYAEQNVEEILRCHGGAKNLTKTSDAIIEAIREAQNSSRKMICFVTGVPGAGKTLAGLNVVHNHKLHNGDLGVFLSGNGPLVKVLREALALDRNQRTGQRMESCRREVSTFIQNVHRFIETYYEDSGAVPVDRVVVFDEAQRAWDRDQSKRKFHRPFSEPELILDAMDRHKDWAVIVALVGNGQEINSGEAGLAEWGRAIEERFPHWDVLISPQLVADGQGAGESLFGTVPANVSITCHDELHLKVSLRAYRADALSQWVSLVLDHEAEAASAMASELAEYPIYLTRDLSAARGWIRERQRGTRRSGILTSSGARRIRPDGLDCKNEIEVKHWFLKPKGDVRSSHALEQTATEFDIQGLEIDWSLMAWGLDLVPVADAWEYNRFSGTAWQNVNQARTRQYILNKYRVLMTRAREGMVIYVSKGDPADPTRPPSRYDAIASFLRRCGVVDLDR